MPQTTTTASPPIPAPWLDLLESTQTLPEPQASSVAQPRSPVAHLAYPYLDVPQFPQNTEFINNTPFAYTSPASTASEPSASHIFQGPPQKRENRYRNAPPSVQSRRRAQNRASQGAYRERKEQRIRDLEQLLHEAHRREETLTQAYLSLRTEHDKLNDETTPAHFDATSMQPSFHVVDGFDLSANLYEYTDSTRH